MAEYHSQIWRDGETEQWLRVTRCPIMAIGDLKARTSQAGEIKSPVAPETRMKLSEDELLICHLIQINLRPWS